jgi:hypothetical protein
MPLPILDLSAYKSHMIQYGEANYQRLLKYPDALDADGNPVGVNDTYYDNTWVCYQIADFTGDKSWEGKAAPAITMYRDRYLKRNNGALPGYWLFPHGLAEAWKRFRDIESFNAYLMLREHGNFVNSSPWNDANQPDWSYMRETAYALHVHLRAADFGLVPDQTRILGLVMMLLSQLEQSFVTMVPLITKPLYRKPFMAALAAHALISYVRTYGDLYSILQTIRTVADYLMNKMWITKPTQFPNNPSFQYSDDAGQGTYETPDLNLLIVPLYAWLFHVTGEQKYIEFGDQVWKSGVSFVNTLNKGKQFDQAYRWSMDYLKYRGV